MLSKFEAMIEIRKKILNFKVDENFNKIEDVILKHNVIGIEKSWSNSLIFKSQEDIPDDPALSCNEILPDVNLGLTYLIRGQESLFFPKLIMFNVKGIGLENNELVFDSLCYFVRDEVDKDEIASHLEVRFVVERGLLYGQVFAEGPISETPIASGRRTFTLGRNSLIRFLTEFKNAKFKKENIENVIIRGDISNNLVDKLLKFYKVKFNMTTDDCIGLSLLRKLGGN